MNKRIILLGTLGMLLLTNFNIITGIGESLELPNDNVLESTSNEKWGLIIDVVAEDYGHTGEQFINVLCKGGWQDDHIEILSDKNVTRLSIWKKFNWLAKHSSNDDTVLIYLSSHGFRGGFGLTNEMPILYLFLNSQINKIQARGIVVIIDTCRSGSAIPFLKKENRVILTACAKDELAVGIFFKITCGLQGFADLEGNNDGFVSAEELYEYATKEARITEIEDGKKSTSDNPQMYDGYPSELQLVTYDENFIDKENIDIYHNHPLNSYGGTAGYEIQIYDSIAQSFKPHNKKLTKIKLCMSIFADDNPTFNISIRRDLNGDDLTSVTITKNDLFSPSSNWHGRFVDVDFPDIEVTPGVPYYIVYTPIYTSSGCLSFGVDNNACHIVDSSTIYYLLNYDNVDRYTEGELYELYDGVWSPWSESEHTKGIINLIFITYGGGSINSPPEKPSISGPANGRARVEYKYTISSTDPNDNYVYYWINWGDGSCEWTGPTNTNENAEVTHTWKKKGDFDIKVKAVDIHGGQSDWNTTKVTMPRYSIITKPLLTKLLETFPNTFPVIRRIIGS